MKRTRVAILFGGRSAEHEISILSARFVYGSLDREKFEPVLIGIDKQGRWLLQQESLMLNATRDPRLTRLNSVAPDVTLTQHPAPTAEVLRVNSGVAQGVDVFFPVLHGPMGEDGAIQGLLELAGVPYVGSGVLGSSVGMDKDVMKRLLAQAGLPVLPHVSVRRADWTKDRAGILQVCMALGLPIFAKPANLGSSVGVGRARTRDELVAAIEDAFRFDTKVICEPGIPNVREIECSVLGNDEPIASIAGEILVSHPDGFYSYTAKYIDESGSSIEIPARLPEDTMREVQRLSIATFRALEGAGLARVDFFLTQDGKLYVNEINTMPGFTAVSMYPKLWEASGIQSRELVERLIELALERANARKELKACL